MRVVSLDAFKESLVEELGNKVAFTVPVLGGFTLDIEGVRYDKSVRGALGRMGRQLEERRMA